MSNKNTLTIGVPTKLHLNGSMVLSLLNSCMNEIKDYGIAIRLLCGKSNIDQARSIIVSQWYDNAKDDDLFLFIDSDQTFTKEDIENLIKLKSDVACGIYCNSIGKPNVFPKEPEKFFNGTSNDIYYAATGFMLIRKPILNKIAEFIKKENNGFNRFWISQNEPNIIPFFKQRFIDSELSAGLHKEWLGEDYGFCWLVRHVGGTVKGHISSTIGHEVPSIKFFNVNEFIKQTQVNNQLTINTPEITTNQSGKKWSDNSIVYYTGNSLIKWSGKNDNLGGSETAVAQLSYYWTQLGFDVTVYGNVEEGTYQGVKYVSVKDFNINDYYATLILWRGFGCTILPYVRASKLIIDLHDHTDSKFFVDPHMQKVERVMVKSMFHRKLFPMIPDSKIAMIPNGVNTQILDVVDTEKYKRQKYRLIYTSSYVRGLEHILMYGFPEIRKHIPQAELHIYYGRDLLQPDFEKHLNKLLDQPGVFEHGRISHQDLAKEFFQSTIHYYLTTSPSAEIDCISIKESLYAGCIPIMSTLAVFPERAGIHIEGDPTKPETQIMAARAIISILNEEKTLKDIKLKLKEFKPKQTYTWDEIANGWIQVLQLSQQI